MSLIAPVIHIDAKYRHKVREVAGQLLKIAVDASMGMGKLIEPYAIGLMGGASVVNSQKDLLSALEELDKETLPEPIKKIVEPVLEEEPDSVKILAEIEAEINK